MLNGELEHLKRFAGGGFSGILSLPNDSSSSLLKATSDIEGTGDDPSWRDIVICLQGEVRGAYRFEVKAWECTDCKECMLSVSVRFVQSRSEQGRHETWLLEQPQLW